MPYLNGKRVSNAEWTVMFGTHEKLHTGPNGENPAAPPTVVDGVPVTKPEAGGNRSKRSAKAAKAAIADALGVKEDSPTLEGIDLSGLDAPAGADQD